MLNWFIGIRQCFDAIGSKLTEGVKTHFAHSAKYFKCRSNCCNNINIYTPKSCAIMNGASNRWMRTVTPNCVKKGESNVSEFYTPKN